MDFSVWPNYKVYQQGQKAMGSLMAVKQQHAQSSRDSSLQREKEAPLQRGETETEIKIERYRKRETGRQTDS